MLSKTGTKSLNILEGFVTNAQSINGKHEKITT